jgi:pimeloyl-ACP methyl ester carboxylesterase
VNAPVFYLHGFASSAKSTKAGYFAERLRERGITLRCPDFNQPDFRTLTLTRMLDQLREQLEASRDRPATVIGSSLGGTLAILAAEKFASRIDRVVLLAPAVMFAKPGHHLLPPERMEEWQREGALQFFHYAYNAERVILRGQPPPRCIQCANRTADAGVPGFAGCVGRLPNG